MPKKLLYIKCLIYSFLSNTWKSYVSGIYNSLITIYIICWLAIVSITSIAYAYPGEGILLGKTFIKPYFYGEVAYDSNIYLSEKHFSDTWLGSRIGILIKRDSERILTDFEVWGLIKKYNKYSDRDYIDAGEDLSLSILIFDKVRLSLSQGFSRSSEDKDFLTDLIGDIRRIMANISLEKEVSDKVSAGIGYGTVIGSYQQNGLYDWLENRASLNLIYKMTEATSAKLLTDISLVKSDGSTNDATVYISYATLFTKLTDKTDIMLGIGWQYQDADTIISIPSSKADINWMATENLIFLLHWDVIIRPSIQYRENYVVIGTKQLGAKLYLTDSVSIDLIGTWQHNSHKNKVLIDTGEKEKLEEDILRGTLEISYTVPMKFLNIFTRFDLINKTSSTGEWEYDRFQTVIGFKAEY